MDVSTLTKLANLASDLANVSLLAHPIALVILGGLLLWLGGLLLTTRNIR